MARRISTSKRLPKRDLKFSNYLVSIFINRILKNGKKELARKIMYKTLQLLQAKYHLNPLIILERAIANVKPKAIIKLLKRKNKRSQKTTVIPVPITTGNFKSINLGVAWVVKFAQKRPGKNLSFKLQNEILDTLKKSGSGAIRKKEELERMAVSCITSKALSE